MIDSLLTLTDDHLREHKHLTLAASSSLNTSLKAPPFHLQAPEFSPISFTPETRYNFPFRGGRGGVISDFGFNREKQTNRELRRGTSGLILANSRVRRLRGEVIFCTDAQSNLLEGT